MASTLRKLRIVPALAVGSLFGGSAAGQCQLAKLVPSDGTKNQAFGISSAVWEDLLVVGAPWVNQTAPYPPGSVYIFQRSGSTWVEIAKILEPGPTTGKWFGRNVAVRDGLVIVAAPYAHRVYGYGGSGWNSLFETEAVGGSQSDYFANALAFDGETIVAGALGDNQKGGFAGAAYVFRVDGAACWQEAKLFASDASGGDEFGCAADVNGDRIIVGAWADEQPGLFNSGAAYVFERDTSGNWSEVAKLLPSDPYSLDNFGISVALQGDEAYVGAMKGGPSDPGAVYVFHRQPSGSWIQAQKLVPSDPDKGSGFGRSLAIEDDTLVIGAYQGNGAVVNSGAAFVFHRGRSGSWQELAILEPQSIASYSELGRNVSLSGNIAVCGVYKDKPSGTLSGSAYLFAVGPDKNGNGVMDPCECPGDINKDWIVDQQDLGALLAAYGTCEGDPGYNPKANLAPGPSPLCPPGVEGIDQADLGVLLANYGNVCP